MRFYRGKVLHFWRTQPGEKAEAVRSGGLDAVATDSDERG